MSYCGKPQFWPLWEAAADAGLPVAAHIEVGSGIANPPTPSGNTRTYEQYVSFMALNYLYHQMNMIAEGVFERFPGLKFVWGDGAGTHRSILPLDTTRAFNEAEFNWKVEAASWKWARLAIWDVAGNGAFVNPVWR